MSIIYSFLQKRKMHESHHGFIMVFAAYAISALMLVLGSDVFYNINTSAAALSTDTNEETKLLQNGAISNLQFVDLTTNSYGDELINPYGLQENGSETTTEATMEVKTEVAATGGDTIWLLGSAMDEKTFDGLMEQMGSLSSESGTSQASMDTSKDSENIATSLSTKEVLNTEYSNVTAKEVKLLERIVESEASGEDMVGKILIVNVIMNRVESEDFPNNIEDVIFQNKNGEYQFSPVGSDRYWSVHVSEESEKAVKRALQGEDYSEGALYFVARKRTSDNAKWFDDHLEWLFKHGGHEFYKNT